MTYKAGMPVLRQLATHRPFQSNDHQLFVSVKTRIIYIIRVPGLGHATTPPL